MSLRTLSDITSANHSAKFSYRYWALDRGHGPSSASGLAAATTYYFYFDRTAPTAISYTASSDDAEGEDRIMLFAVTTTDSSEFCVVHPLGVIHV